MSADDAMRAFAHALFTDPDAVELADEATDKQAPGGNHVPREGHTPAPPPRNDMHDFARRLFGYDD